VLIDVVVIHHGFALECHDERNSGHSTEGSCISAIPTEALHVEYVGQEVMCRRPQLAQCCDGASHAAQRSWVSSWEREYETPHGDAVDRFTEGQLVAGAPRRPHLDGVPAALEVLGETRGEHLDATNSRRVGAG
jgi:hypothetical protein